MNMEYLIDGYNLCFCEKFAELTQIPTGRKLCIEEMRSMLESLLIDLISCGKQTHKNYRLVFDSSQNFAIQSYQVTPYLRISFSPDGLCADRYISEIVRGTSEKKRKLLYIVSEDTGLKSHCFYLGAKTLSSREFFDFLEKKKSKQKPLALEKQEGIFESLKNFYIDTFEKNIPKKNITSD